MILLALFLSASLLIHSNVEKAKDQYVHSFPYRFNSPMMYYSKVRLRAVGDIMFHKGLQKYALTNPMGFKALFRNIKTEILEADISFANLESPIAKSFKPSGWPRFNGDPSVLPALKDTGFDILSTANNHTMDKKDKGVTETIEAIESVGIVPVGSIRKKDSPLRIIWKKGIKLGFLAFAEHTNKIPVPEGWPKVFILDVREDGTAESAIQLIKASKPSVDVLIVSYHFGGEYLLKPESYKRKVCHQLLEAGADVLLGHHPHVLQRGEKYVTKDGRECFIIYSLGNFVSGQVQRVLTYDSRHSKRCHYNDGAILDLQVVKGIGGTAIYKVGFIPTWTQVGRYKALLKTATPKKRKKFTRIAQALRIKPNRKDFSYHVINIQKELEGIRKGKSRGLRKLLEYRLKVIIDRFNPDKSPVVKKVRAIKSRKTRRKKRQRKLG